MSFLSPTCTAASSLLCNFRTLTYHSKFVHFSWDVLNPSCNTQLMANSIPSSAFYTNMLAFSRKASLSREWMARSSGKKSLNIFLAQLWSFLNKRIVTDTRRRRRIQKQLAAAFCCLTKVHFTSSSTFSLFLVYDLVRCERRKSENNDGILNGERVPTSAILFFRCWEFFSFSVGSCNSPFTFKIKTRWQCDGSTHLHTFSEVFEWKNAVLQLSLQ